MAESHREEIAKLEALYAGNPGGRVFVHLAEAYRKAGEHERARRILDEGLARHPDSASGFVVLGRVLADMQISDDAATAFRRVLELDGGNLVALRWLGDLARQSGRSAEAAMHYRELLIRNPSNEEVRDLVEIVEREAGSSSVDAETGTLADWGALDVDGGILEPEGADAVARFSSDADAVSPPIAAAEDAAVSEPRRTEGDESDVTPWSAAPGQTGDAEEPPVEYGLVELETVADPSSDSAEEGRDEAPADHAATGHDARSDAAYGDEPESAGPAGPGQAPEYPGGEPTLDDSGIVESVEDDDGPLLELDELRRDDEAGPVEIHLLDPSFDGSETDDDEYVTELDLSDLSSTTGFDDEGDYADDSFVADLSAAGQEEPEPDELHVDDVMEAGAALTLLPGTDAPETSEASETPFDATAGHNAVWDLEEPGSADLAGAVEAADATAAPPDVAPVEAEEEAVGGAESAQPEAGFADAVEEPAYAAGERVFADPADVAASETSGEPPRKEETLVTETMAVLYRSQGHHEMAADVYRSLLRGRPGDERLAAKLRDAEEAAASARPGAAAHASPAGDREGDRPDEESGEVWLRGVGTAWTGAGDAAGGDETPYAWTPEPEDGEAGEPIGSYLKDLVGWKVGAGRWSPPAEVAGDAQGADFTDVPDWLDGPGGGHTEWTPDSAPPVQEATEPAAEGVRETSADSRAWDRFGAPPASSEGSITEPADTGEEQKPEPPPAWSSPAAADPSADPWSVPGSTDEVTAVSDSLDDGTDDSGMGWTPLDLDNDIPAVAPRGATGEPGHEVTPVAPSDAGDESADDDDLEMFRSWLQSLKK